MQMNQISLDINKADQIINEPVVLRVGEEDQTITVNLLKDGQPYTSFTTATFFANKPSGAIVANDPANISNGVITYTVPQALVNEFGKITNAYFLIDGKVSTESFVIAVLQGVNISDDLNDYIPGMSNLNVIYDKWKDKLQAITDELAGIDAPKEVKNVIDNELKNYTDQINELQRRITALKAQLDALEVPVNAVGTNFLTNSDFSSGLDGWRINGGSNSDCKVVVTTDSDGDTCAHITGTGNSCGLWRTPVSFDQNQVMTGSLLAKGIGTYLLVGLDNRIRSDFGTISTKSYSKIGSVANPGSNPANFCLYFNAVNGVVDIYVKSTKLEKGSIATDWCPNPDDKVNVGDMRKPASDVAGIEEVSTLQTQVDNSAVGTNLLSNSRGKLQPNKSRIDNNIVYFDASIYMTQGQQYTVHADASSGLVWSGTHQPNVESNNVTLWLTDKTNSNFAIISDANTGTGTTFTWNKPSGTYYLRVNTYKSDNSGYVENVKIEKGTTATDWCPNPSEILTVSDMSGKTITATDDTGKTVNLKITGIS